MIILVAEDDPNDTLLLQRAFQKNGIDLPVQICRDGAEAVAYLKGEGAFADREKFPFPRVVITDLKMPRCSGFELLEYLDQHPECAVIPVIVLSASADDKDVQRCFQLGANAYFRKPTSFAELCDLVRLNYEYWRRSLIPAPPANC